MRTYNRICIKDYTLSALNKDCLELKRGKEYLTSPAENGEVTVFTNFWVKVPEEIFAGEVLFTP
jgi:hypothetical protein